MMGTLLDLLAGGEDRGHVMSIRELVGGGLYVVVFISLLVLLAAAQPSLGVAPQGSPQAVNATASDQKPTHTTVIRERSKFTAVKVFLPQYDIDRLRVSFSHNETVEYVAYAAPGATIRVGLEFNETYTVEVQPVEPANATHTHEIEFTPYQRDRLVRLWFKDGDG